MNLCAHHWEEIECYNSANLRFISSQADFVEKKEDSLIIIDTVLIGIVNLCLGKF